MVPMLPLVPGGGLRVEAGALVELVVLPVVKAREGGTVVVVARAPAVAAGAGAGADAAGAGAGADAAGAGAGADAAAGGARGGRPAGRDFFFLRPPPEVPRLRPLEPSFPGAGGRLASDSSGKASPAKPSRCATSIGLTCLFALIIPKMSLIVPNTLDKGVPYTGR